MTDYPATLYKVESQLVLNQEPHVRVPVAHLSHLAAVSICASPIQVPSL